MSGIAGQFDDTQQRQQSARLGMWIFLATEVLFFGALFFVYAISRARYANDFSAASRHTDVFYGTLNTAILLTSSFTIALAVRASELHLAQQARRLLYATAALGIAFLVVKGLEYHKDYTDHLVPTVNFQFDPAHAHGAEVFFSIYFVTTGLHALHLTIGIVTLLLVSRRIKASAVEVTGLYWHFVDIVWLFLYPLLYLVSRA